MRNALYPEYEIFPDGTIFRVVKSKRGRNDIQIFGRILKSGYRQFKLVGIDGKRHFERAAREGIRERE